MDDRGAPASPLQAQFKKLLQRRRQESKLRSLKASPPGSVDFSSNDFLSLSTFPLLKESFLLELQHQPSLLGSTGSRLLDGNSTFAEDLERHLASFHGGQAGLLANSGFDANVGLFSCVPQLGDVILYDELIHASVHDGIKLSRAGNCLPFSHNSVSSLRQLIERLQLEDSAIHLGQKNVFVAVESVYSMDGDLAPLTEIVELLEDFFPQKNAHVIVDEAHATGVYGPLGKGRVSELGLEDRIFARLHTFGKALACNGAIIICCPLTRLYLINYARPLIYTTFMSYTALSAIKVVYTFMAQGLTEPLAKNLFNLVESLHGQLQALQTQYSKSISLDGILEVPSRCPESPIFSLMTPHPRSLAQYCQDAGFVVRAVVPPTVPEGTERVRVCLHAGNTEDQILAFVRRVRQWVDGRQAMISPSFVEMKARI